MKRPATIDIRHGGLPPWIGPALQTRQGQALVQGRARQADGKAAIPGLGSFACATAKIWNAAAAGDPYADLALLRIESALADAQAAVRTELRLVATLLEADPGSGTGPAGTAYPARVPPPPANPYGHLGACLLADFDRLARAILAARQRDAIDRGRAHALLFEAGRPVRRAFALPSAVWRDTGVTRQDMRQGTRLARRARAAYARLQIPGIPVGVLHGTERGVYAPPASKARLVRRNPRAPLWRAHTGSPQEGRR